MSSETAGKRNKPAPMPFYEVDTFLFEVTWVFTFHDQFHILCNGLLPEGPHVRVGQALSLRAPDGRETRTYIHGIQMIRRNLDFEGIRYIPISIPIDVDKNAIPEGTQVWAVKGEVVS